MPNTPTPLRESGCDSFPLPSRAGISIPSTWHQWKANLLYIASVLEHKLDVVSCDFPDLHNLFPCAQLTNACARALEFFRFPRIHSDCYSFADGLQDGGCPATMKQTGNMHKAKYDIEKQDSACNFYRITLQTPAISVTARAVSIFCPL